MNDFKLFASPFWVNFLILVPVLLYIFWRKNKLNIKIHILFSVAVFGTAFGFVEAACVVYLRGTLGFLPGFQGDIFQIWKEASTFYSQRVAVASLPQSMLTIELLRETATMVMLLSVAVLGAKKVKERIALFLLAFSFWDIFYYVFLFLTVRWPQTLTTPDVLFLIPSPWVSQVWFPILISLMTISAIFINSKRGNK